MNVTVTIKSLGAYTTDDDITTVLRVDNGIDLNAQSVQLEITERAVRKIFGKNYWFMPNTGLINQGVFGQVVESAPGKPWHGNCVTPQVRIDIERQRKNCV